MSGIDDLPALRDVIATHGLSARKALGQNFLLDLNLTAKIARAAGDLSGCDVLEVGPGPGGLTRGLLAEGARRVLAIEKDHWSTGGLLGSLNLVPNTPELHAVLGMGVEGIRLTHVQIVLASNRKQFAEIGRLQTLLQRVAT